MLENENLTWFSVNYSILRVLGYAWFLENTKERKKNVKENDFFHVLLLYEKYQRISNIIKTN